MHEKLNYRRPYGAQGGDWGAVVSSWLAFDHPVKDEKDDWKSGVAGLHLNMAGVRPGIDLKTTALSAAEKDWLGRMGELDDKTAYQRIQATRPQTLGVALTDSPVGLAAWIVEKFRDWSDCDGDPLNRFSMDTLLDNIMVYWLTGTAGTATWLYRGVTQQKPRALPPGGKVEAPTGFAAFPEGHRAGAAEGMARARLRPAPPHRDAQGRPFRRARGARRCWSRTSARSSGRSGSARRTIDKSHAHSTRCERNSLSASGCRHYASSLPNRSSIRNIRGRTLT